MFCYRYSVAARKSTELSDAFRVYELCVHVQLVAKLSAQTRKPFSDILSMLYLGYCVDRLPTLLGVITVSALNLAPKCLTQPLTDGNRTSIGRFWSRSRPTCSTRSFAK